MPRQPKKISQFDVALGAVIRGQRTKRDITQAQLSARTGIPLSNLQRREDGANEITVSELERIAAALNMEPQDLADEALSDFGGLGKLVAEHSAMSEGVISLDSQREKKQKKPLSEEAARKKPHAAVYDPENEQTDD